MRFPLSKMTLLAATVFLLAAGLAAGAGTRNEGKEGAEQIPAPGGVHDEPAADDAADGDSDSEPSRGCDDGRGECCDDDCCCVPCICGSRWTFASDLLVLGRPGSGKQPLLTTANMAASVLTSGGLNPPATLGFDFDAVRHNVFGTCFDLELGYFQADFSMDADADGPVRVVVGNGVRGNEALAVTSPAAHYNSGLHLAELNLRREWFPGLTFLAGFRMGELAEHYAVNAAGSTVGGQVITLETKSFNHLYGFQVGADAELLDSGRPLQLRAICKAGVYGNATDQKNHLTDSATQLDEIFGATSGQTAFLGETGLMMTYMVNCHLSLHATVTAAWLEGVALAPQQLGSTDFAISHTATVDTHGGFFYYGGGLGAELDF